MNSRASTFPATMPAANAPRRWVPAPLVQLSTVFHCAAAVVLLLYPAHWLAIVLTLLANHAVLGVFGMWPRSRLIDANLVRLPRAAAERGEVSLTFDDGPNPEVTPRVLELLDCYGAKASFFFAATQAAAHPELVQEVMRRGHSVENHSYSHSHVFAAYGWGRLRRDIERSQALIAGISGRLPEFFRAPMGLRSPMLDPLLAQAGLRYVSWTRRGYDTISGNAPRVLERLTRGLKAGDVLLLHDGTVARTPAGEPVVLAVLPPLLQQLAEQGLKSVTLPTACNGPR